MKITKFLVIAIIIFIIGYFTQSYWMPLLNPTQEMQDEIIETETTEEISMQSSCITITAPQANQAISFPLTVTASIDYACWVIFEAQAGVVSLLQNNQVASDVAFLMVDGEYYEEVNYPVTAQAVIQTTTATTGSADIIITPENPCGESPECPPVPDPILVPVMIQ